MPSENWYCHIQGETFGPVSTEVVSIMLRQNRLQFSDWVWTAGLTKWTRLGDVHQFAALLPPYPSAPIPAKHQVISADQAPAPAKAPARAPAPPPKPHAKAHHAPKEKEKDHAEAPDAGSARTAPRAESPLKAWIRRYGRVRIEGSAIIEGYGTYEASDISEGGIFLRASTPIPFGTDLKFRVEAPFLQKPLEMTGIVIREGASEAGEAGFAIQFTRVNPAHRRIIHDHVKSQTKAAA